MKKLLLVLAFVAFASPLYAQSIDSIKQFTPFNVAADHDGVDVIEFRLYRNGVLEQSKAASSLLAGVITFDRYLDGMVKGVYVFYAEAIGSDGIPVASTTLTVTVFSGSPNAPKNLRIVR